VNSKLTETHNKKREKADMVKYEKQEVSEQVNMQKQQDQLKNASIKQMVRNQEMEIQEKKQRDVAEKRARARQELQRKIVEEN
jgi:hypothetical protein